MSRGFLASIERARRDAIREAERQQRLRVRIAREAERSQRANQRMKAALDKDQKRLYVEARLAEVDGKNQELEKTVDDLSSLLPKSLSRDPSLSFDGMLVTPQIPPLDLEGLDKPISRSKHQDFMPTMPFWLVRWLPWVRRSYAASVVEAEANFAARRLEEDRHEVERLHALRAKKEEHQQLEQTITERAKKHNEEVTAFRDGFQKGDSDAIASLMQLVLTGSAYPEGFPRNAEVVYVSESKQLVVEYDLPIMDDVVPVDKSYKYIKASDTETASPRPENQRRALYASVVCQTVLRSLHELFGADTYGHIESIVFNAHVDAIDKGTGQHVRPCLVSVRTTKDLLQTIDLSRVDAAACLVTLSGSVSKSPSELAPVRPILELRMVDPRFVKEADILGTLDQRPNLMDLKPSEFESLITNLFQKMGLDTKQTRPSRDGGVDCVAFDPRPIFGGKVVIQAKRYKNTVGVSSVRDLYGTMQNEGASKGILVTTSGYGKASYEFANDKPLELLSGSNLLFLLKEHAGLDAKIVVPDDWKDPLLDLPESEPEK